MGNPRADLTAAYGFVITPDDIKPLRTLLHQVVATRPADGNTRPVNVECSFLDGSPRITDFASDAEPHLR